MHERLHKIAKRISKTRFKSLPYTTPDDVYQAAYIGALLASRKPEFRADDPGADWWLYAYALQQVSAQEQPLNKATSRCPRKVVDRGGRHPDDHQSYTHRPSAISPEVRHRMMARAQNSIDRRILAMRLDTDMTLGEIGVVVGLAHTEVYKRFKRIRMWARKQDFMLTTYHDLTGKPYETPSRSNRNPHQGHHPSGHSEPKCDESGETDHPAGGD